MNDVVHTRAETPANTEDSMDKDGQVLSIELPTGGHGPVQFWLN